MSAKSDSSTQVISAEALLEHWQGHRRLTRRVIEAFPGGPVLQFLDRLNAAFGAMALELLSMAEPMVRGIVTGEWDQSLTREERPRKELLRLWDESTTKIDALWPKIPLERFQQKMTAFGQYPGRVHELLFYVIDNEIHHRGEGYVYLRALGIAPATIL
jgi:uncharacterized damage-inducible protein DinB